MGKSLGLLLAPTGAGPTTFRRIGTFEVVGIYGRGDASLSEACKVWFSEAGIETMVFE